MDDTQVAVLGSGIAGSIVACLLADRGYRVALVDRNEAPMSAASRWNEGKIHLGFTYVGTSSPATARLMVEGAAVFEAMIERVCGSAPATDWYTGKVIYVVDPDSQFPHELLLARSRAVADCLAQAAHAAPGLSRYRRGEALRVLDADTASRMTGVGRIQAAWETPERAVSPRLLAASLRNAVQGRALDRVRGEIRSVQRAGARWRIGTDAGDLLADAVVNCSWESRHALDRPLRAESSPVSIRYKYALFGQGLPQPAGLAPSTRILGRFGDITPYGNGDLYLSWYPAGLAGLSNHGQPPVVAPVDEERLIADTLAGLGLDRAVLQRPQARWQVGGGFVVAPGSGDIDHAASPLHERCQPVAREIAPGYVSVDTGKFSLGPLLAGQAASLVAARLGGARRRYA
jgi:hypothetical protein